MALLDKVIGMFQGMNKRDFKKFKKRVNSDPKLKAEFKKFAEILDKEKDLWSSRSSDKNSIYHGVDDLPDY